MSHPPDDLVPRIEREIPPGPTRADVLALEERLREMRLREIERRELEQARRPRRLWHRSWFPPLLYALTWLTTFAVFGPVYSAALMTILTLHEAGHYFQCRRYGIPATLPFFIPVPAPPFGTMGAVIAMGAHRADRRQLFDIAVSGPLAGLVPALVATWVGIAGSEFVAQEDLGPGGMEFREPLIFRWMAEYLLGPTPEGHILVINALGWAGWVGVFITALNLIPIGQLDGGHLLYALIGRRAHAVAIVLMAAWLALIISGARFWILFWLLIYFFGVRHPPTADDSVPLGLPRQILGWATLLFFVIGFTPEPFIFPE